MRNVSIGQEDRIETSEGSGRGGEYRGQMEFEKSASKRREGGVTADTYVNGLYACEI